MKKSIAAKRLTSRILRHHAPLALGCGTALLVTAEAVGGSDPKYRWSMATAYVSLALLVATLSLGPLYMFRRSRVPVSFDLRRDLGIWAGLVGLAHTTVGALVHMGNPLLYIFRTDPYPNRLVLRTDLFGFANYTGLTAVFIVSVLLATSSDAAIKRLGTRRWKWVQRWAYGLMFLVVVHGAAYQVIESRRWVYVLFLAGFTFAVAVAQGMGFYKRRMQTGDA